MTYNFEIEKSVLGCLMLDNSLIENTQQELSKDYFYHSNHAKLFDEIVECYKNKGIADITVLQTMSIEELSYIINFVPTTQSFSFYKKELTSLKAKRDMLKQLDVFKTRIMDNDCIVEDVKMECLNAISSISTHEKINEKFKMFDVLMEYIDILEQKQLGKTNYKKWGIKWLDDKTGGLKPALTYLAARPSVGKTALAIQIARTIAKQGLNVAFFSLEMDKISLCNRLVCNSGGIDKSILDKSGGMSDENWGSISKVICDLQNLPISIYDKYYTVEEILMEAEEQRVRTGLDLLIIDYVQLMETKQRCNSPNERVSHISRQLKKYQQKTGIHILALSQFNRETEMKKFPTLANLRDSGSLEQDANNVFFLHEEYVEPHKAQNADHKEILLIIAKQREGERNICCKMKFYGKTQRFFQKGE